MRHCWGGAGRAAVAGGGDGEGKWLWQWWACRSIVGVAAVQCLHGGIVGISGGGQTCCGVGEAAVGPQWQGGMAEVAGVALFYWCIGGIVTKIVLSHYLLLASQSLLCDNVFFVRRH
jgi:hypothetical protein